MTPGTVFQKRNRKFIITHIAPAPTVSVDILRIATVICLIIVQATTAKYVIVQYAEAKTDKM